MPAHARLPVTICTQQQQQQQQQCKQGLLIAADGIDSGHMGHACPRTAASDHLQRKAGKAVNMNLSKQCSPAAAAHQSCTREPLLNNCVNRDST